MGFNSREEDRKVLKISVVVPIYNVENYLDKCLYSLYEQTFKNFEVICVNDGSLDKSEEIIDKYIELNNNIFKKINKINGGLSDARNVGLDYCKGQYVMFLDSDDWIEKECLEDMLSLLEETDSDVVVCGINNVTLAGKILNKCCLFEKKIISKEELLLQSNSAANILFKRSLFEEIRFPLNKWFEDLATIPLVLAKCNRIGAVDKCYYNYLYRPNSITKTYNDKILDILDAFNKILKVKEYDNNFITELYSTHLYYTLIRVANIKDKSIKLNIYDKLQSFTEDNFSKDYLSTLYLGFNQSIINHLFFSKKYKSLNILLYLEWKIKNLQIKIKN
ncbi:glycosyltransferase [Turicibacter sanguinis]|nr:glycosyltransferase [Turicibacter sanguinis]MTN52185.1 glycosyltransferase [Turicibacter sanguinis]MTN55226.1 glycosyltransferase [Turicibacter sanguinis]MTN58448.1 glycosyltransferase [Turicibacter sanguinis]MTN61558.1 glycosyltransferase [Turicibacter sanguinis]